MGKSRSILKKTYNSTIAYTYKYVAYAYKWRNTLKHRQYLGTQ